MKRRTSGLPKKSTRQSKITIPNLYFEIYSISLMSNTADIGVLLLMKSSHGTRKFLIEYSEWIEKWNFLSSLTQSFQLYTGFSSLFNGLFVTLCPNSLWRFGVKRIRIVTLLVYSTPGTVRRGFGVTPGKFQYLTPGKFQYLDGSMSVTVQDRCEKDLCHCTFSINTSFIRKSRKSWSTRLVIKVRNSISVTQDTYDLS